MYAKWSSVAITVLAEIASLYPPRGKSSSPEALLTAGSLALGREPCKAYPGWGIVSPWNRASFVLPNTGPEGYSGVCIPSPCLPTPTPTFSSLLTHP
jgi:hypothetical protein